MVAARIDRRFHLLHHLLDPDHGFAGEVAAFLGEHLVLDLQPGRAGKAVIALDEMVQKVKAAVDARRDGDLQIIARTDACAIEGLDPAIGRAQAYIEAGADVAFVEAPTNLAELARIPREIAAPHVANIVFGGKTPDPGRAELAKLGFSLVLYANAVLQAAVKAAWDVLGALKRDGSLAGVADRIASFEERQRVVQKPCWDALESKFRTPGD